MAEEQAAVQEPEKTEDLPYQIKVEDAGPATKKISIEIPPEVIATKLEEQFRQIRREAAIPGFRPGHAPQKLVEKRFHNDVREQVRRTLISESYGQAVEKHSLQVIGEPKFDKPDDISLPETGSLTYSFEVEVQPDITLPSLVSLKVKRPKVEVTEEHVDRAMMNLREQQGTLVPVEDRGVEPRDQLIADVHLSVDGAVVSHLHDEQIIARPGRIGGIQIDDLDSRVAAMRPGEKREFTVHAPATHSDEKLRDKDVVIEIALKELKKLELAEINQQFLQSLGFANEAELRAALHEQMLERVKYDVQQTMREQVYNYLLQNVQMELPTALSDRQAERVLQRRSLDMMMRGMPRDQVDASLESLRGQAKEEAVRDLKLFFILQKVAAQQNVDVGEPELNGRIAMLAGQSGKRPEKVKQEMSADGSLMNMYVQMREQKAIDKILELALVEDVDLPEQKPATEANP